MATQVKPTGKAAATKAKATNSVLFIGVNIKDQAKDKEFNEWYNKEHLMDVLSTGVYHRATRWQNTNPQPGIPKYIAFYETERTDPDAARTDMSKGMEEMRRTGKGGHVHETLERVVAGNFKLCGSLDAGK